MAWDRSATSQRTTSPVGYLWFVDPLGSAGKLSLQGLSGMTAVGDASDRIAVGDVALVQSGGEEPLAQADENPGR